MTESPYAGQVREYLAYCEDARTQLEARHGRLDPKHHPSAEGAVKLIPHGSDRARADAIRQAFAQVTVLAADIPRPEAEPELGAGP